MMLVHTFSLYIFLCSCVRKDNSDNAISETELKCCLLLNLVYIYIYTYIHIYIYTYIHIYIYTSSTLLLLYRLSVAYQYIKIFQLLILRKIYKNVYKYSNCIATFSLS